MSDDILNSDEPLVTPLSEEEKLEGLKAKARSLGIRFHPKIKNEKLLAKINAYYQENERENANANHSPEVQMALAKANVAPRAARSLSERRKAQLELVRVRVSPLNVHMNGLKGQVFTVCNGLVGTISKYIPFNSPYGWHIPRILYEELESKKYQVFRDFKTPTGKTVIKNELVKAYAIEVLPPLSADEYRAIQENIRSTHGQEDY